MDLVSIGAMQWSLAIMEFGIRVRYLRNDEVAQWVAGPKGRVATRQRVMTVAGSSPALVPVWQLCRGREVGRLRSTVCKRS